MHLKIFLSAMTMLLASSAWADEPQTADVLILRSGTAPQAFHVQALPPSEPQNFFYQTIPLSVGQLPGMNVPPPSFQPHVVRLVGLPAEENKTVTLSVGNQSGQNPPDVLYIQGTPVQPGTLQVQGTGRLVLSSDFWLGVECYPALPVLRVHLNLPENEGLVISTVMPDSPAAKAGLETNDILLTAGEKKLGTVQDLSQTVDAAKETPLKLEIIHAGKAKTVEITPSKRPQNMVFKQEGTPEDWNAIEKWMQKMQSGAGANVPQQFQFRVFQPGAILPPGAPVQQPMPGNMSINVNRNGDKPADITVKWNDQKYETTEDKLDKLPPEVRPHVERMLGRGKLQIVGPAGANGGAAGGSIGGWVLGSTMPAPPPGMLVPPPGTIPAPGPQMQVQPFRSLEQQLEEMNRKIDQLQKELHERLEDHQPAVTPEKDLPAPEETQPAEEPEK